MKTKLLSILTLLLAVSAVTFAQSTPFLQAGIKGGVNITKIDGSSFKDEFRYGYHLGGFAVVKLSEKFGIQPEVLFNQYNSKIDTSFGNTLNTDNLKDVSLNYLSIPLLLNYSPTKLFTLQAGPQFGILMNKGDNLLNNGKNAFNSGDFSMIGGLQLNLSNFKISGRYVVGLNDIGDLDNKESWKNQGFQVSVGLRIL